MKDRDSAAGSSKRGNCSLPAAAPGLVPEAAPPGTRAPHSVRPPHNHPVAWPAPQCHIRVLGFLGRHLSVPGRDKESAIMADQEFSSTFPPKNTSVDSHLCGSPGFWRRSKCQSPLAQNHRELAALRLRAAVSFYAQHPSPCGTAQGPERAPPSVISPTPLSHPSRTLSVP